MILILLVIGAILIVAAFRNSQQSLFAALYEDIPAFITWAAAIFAIGAVGFIPGLKPVSRGILALVLVVIVLRNYKQIIAGFENTWKNPTPAMPAGTPGKGDITGQVDPGLFGISPGEPHAILDLGTEFMRDGFAP